MSNTAIIIPTRLAAKRLPNKPLIEIEGLPMIIHVMKRALESNIGEVYITSPDIKIIELVKQHGGNGILSSPNHKTGSDRIYEVHSKILKEKNDIIINLQGDMPNIKPESIYKLNNFMRKKTCDIGTLAAEFKNEDEIKNKNVVKVKLSKKLKDDDFLKAQDFFRLPHNLSEKILYHHIGCYAFTDNALSKFVKLPQSNLEL